MFKYKTIKQQVPWCDKCDSQIYGNGSMATPYKCQCGQYEFNYKDFKYELPIK